MKTKNGLLTIVKKHGDSIVCRCECGQTIKTTKDKFYKAKSCGCLKIKRLQERSKIKVGTKFGFLEAIEPFGKDDYGNYLWLCRCFCGNERKIRSSKLLSGKSKSCGCVASALRNESFYSNHPALAEKVLKKK